MEFSPKVEAAINSAYRALAVAANNCVLLQDWADVGMLCPILSALQDLGAS